MAQGYFIAGTDTGVGKTGVSLSLMRHLQNRGRCVTGMKPVASGCRLGATGWANDDALKLQNQASLPVPYPQVNPYALREPIAPHLAAQAQGVEIRLAVIEAAFAALARVSDSVVVEGVGGWLVPIDASRSMADVAQALGLPVLLVVAVRLGCINHALLTAAAIERVGVKFIGWVANRLDPDCEAADETVAALTQRLPVPCVAEVPYVRDEADLGVRFAALGA